MIILVSLLIASYLVNWIFWIILQVDDYDLEEYENVLQYSSTIITTEWRKNKAFLIFALFSGPIFTIFLFVVINAIIAQKIDETILYKYKEENMKKEVILGTKKLGFNSKMHKYYKKANKKVLGELWWKEFLLYIERKHNISFYILKKIKEDVPTTYIVCYFKQYNSDKVEKMSVENSIHEAYLAILNFIEIEEEKKKYN